MQQIEMKVELVSIDKIKPHPENPRANHKVDRIINSITAFGWRQPIVVDTEGVIIAGHGRYYAAQKMKLPQVPVHFARDLTPSRPNR